MKATFLMFPAYMLMDERALTSHIAYNYAKVIHNDVLSLESYKRLNILIVLMYDLCIDLFHVSS